MTLNIIGYFIFLIIVIYIIIIVGRICYKNGNVYVLELVKGNEELCLRINKILLTGYYLINIGYAAMTLIRWKSIENIPELVEAISFKTSVIIAILSVLHYLNITFLTFYSKKLIQ